MSTSFKVNSTSLKEPEEPESTANASASGRPVPMNGSDEEQEQEEKEVEAHNAKDLEDEFEDPYAGKWCGGFGNHTKAKGYNILGTARGPIAMSNIFLSTALIYLASEEVGCVEETEDGGMQVVENCEERVFGAFRPSALITNIAVISGLMSACLMPLVGAIIDYTPRRWSIGVTSAILITLIQIVQIGTVSSTWFPMAILQAITGFFYQVQMCSTFAYMPEIKREVSTLTMTRFSSTWTMVQFGSQALFLLVIVGISMAFSFNDVITAQVSQGINSVNIIIAFTVAWRMMPKVPARHTLEPGQWLLLQGFKQNWRTAKRIQKHYKRSIRWYLLGILFAEPGANAFTVVSVVFLSDKLGLSGTELGIFFLVVLVCMVPGGLVSQAITRCTNPSISFRFSMMFLFVLGIIGALTLTKDNVKPIGYVWALFVGLGLGSFYPSEKLYLSMIVPKGIEAELSGFYVYCSQLLGWLPPLMFTLLVEANVDQKYGLICTVCFFLVAVAMISMSPSFDKVLEEVHQNDFDLDVEDSDDTNNNPNNKRTVGTKNGSSSMDSNSVE
ncbi:Vacuole effluxer Atg22 like [Seminavis robusta]|uniref:Vacuole effluxer Atg22 like n=1 Tax=Seminavis robusta TaxID=568900 RepID=A0A9N8DU18_9STRA|nr:Vacuole effluxer Atg22 like [Seminavis robusta]|eukprot:Sro290_g109240.1 Vacuole effluxer Atg22 like (557) ;mRNA; f:8159-10086